MTTHPSLLNSVDDRDTWVADNILDPSTFLPWPIQDQLLGSVQHLAENTEDVILLVGPHGAGKTTLIYRMQSVAPDHWVLCRVDVNPMLNSDQLFHRLAGQIGLDTGEHSLEHDFSPPEDGGQHQNLEPGIEAETEADIEFAQFMPLSDAALADALHVNFSNLRLQGQLPIIFVDDADKLPVSTLQALLQLHSRLVEGLSPFALIMLAEPTPAMGEASDVQRLELPRLSLEQMEPYIQHFLKLGGIAQAPKWDPEQLTAIYEKSTGLPGKVNALIKKALREDAVSIHKPSIGWRLLLFFAGIIGITILGLAALKLPAIGNFLGQFTAPSQRQTNSKEGWTSQSLPLPPPTPSISITAPRVSTPQAVTSEPLIPPISAQSSVISNQTQLDAAEQPPVLPIEPNAWVTQQPATVYTLQLAVVSDEARGKRYITQHNIANRGAYVKIPRGNRSPVYYVLYGTYKTRGEAIKALNRLPVKIRKSGAWPRLLGEVQSKLR